MATKKGNNSTSEVILTEEISVKEIQSTVEEAKEVKILFKVFNKLGRTQVIEWGNDNKQKLDTGETWVVTEECDCIEELKVKLNHLSLINYVEYV